MAQSGNSRAVLYIFVFVVSSILLTWRFVGTNDSSIQDVARDSINLKNNIISRVQNTSLWNVMDPSSIMKVVDRIEVYI